MRILHLCAATCSAREPIHVGRTSAGNSQARRARRLPRSAVHIGRTTRAAIRRCKEVACRQRLRLDSALRARHGSVGAARNWFVAARKRRRFVPRRTADASFCVSFTRNDDRNVARRFGMPSWRARQSAAATPRHVGVGWRVADSVHHRNLGGHWRNTRRPHRRIDGNCRVSCATRPRARSNRAELFA